MPQCRDAEDRLLQSFPSLVGVQQRDTEIVLHDIGRTWLHSLELPAGASAVNEPPLVFLPGYCTGAAFFLFAWRHMLAHGPWADEPARRPQLLALDPLGWYLSDHPDWTAGTDPGLAEAWFVDSLEQWRAVRGIERMQLVGHSIGGYLATAYAERYPSRVHSLTLVSPAGLPGEPEGYRQRLASAPWRPWLMLTAWGRGWTPQHMLRRMPQQQGWKVAHWNALRWTKGYREYETLDETAFADYIYHGWQEGPASGAQALGALLHPGAWGKKPLSERLPRLKLPRIELIYGEEDWMDVRHGNAVAERCEAQPSTSPAVWVQLIPDAGHYSHISNVEAFATALHTSLGERRAGGPRAAPVPPGIAERFSSPNAPAWRSWEGYDFGR